MISNTVFYCVFTVQELSDFTSPTKIKNPKALAKFHGALRMLNLKCN